ncbi:MAG: extracellular solute-binding protein [Catenulispora sp.]|nr:extracellular solute-binding protein [Catenulispora sp.]
MQRIIGGRYELGEELGSGAFGRVWRGRDLRLRAEVAVKEVWLAAVSEQESAQRLARAEREARNAARLRGHPNIVAVHDVVIDDGKPWIVMDYVVGRSLADHLREHGALPAEQAVKLAQGLLSALGAAQEQGIVHRDVKPANVLLAADGRVLLTDFGIAVHGSDTAITASDTLVGTLEYMPPERFNGMDAGPAGDLYSLGVTLFQAIEGYSPFHRETPTETLTAVVLGSPPQPARAGRLTPLLAGLLAKDPAARPTVRQALALLEGAGAGAGAGSGVNAGSGAGGNRRRTALIAAGTAVVVAAAVVTGVVLSSGDDHSGAIGVSQSSTSASLPTQQVETASSASAPSSTPSSGGPTAPTSAGSAALSSTPLSAPVTSTSDTPAPATSTSDTAAPASLTIWLTVDAKDLWPQAVTDANQEFQRAFPNVNVKLVYLTADGYQAKLSTTFTAGSQPDVMELFTADTQKLIAAGRLQDMTAYKSGFDNSATWRDNLVQSCTSGDKLFCVPYYADTNGTVVSGADLGVASGVAHPEWAAAWIKAFTSTAVERQIAKVVARPPYKYLANTTTIS